MHPTDTPGYVPPPPRPAKIKVYKRPFATFRTVIALMLREMATTYGRSPGGFLWVILEPAAGVAILSAIFSAAVRDPALGSSFPLYYATGFIPFSMFMNIHGKVAWSLTFSQQLLAYPSVTWIDAFVARFLLNWIAYLLVTIVVFGGVVFGLGVDVVVHLPTVLLALVTGGILAFSVGAMNCYLYLRFPVWQRAFAIITKPLFFLSCVFFLYEQVPQPFGSWLWWNPIVHVVGLMRRAFYPSYDADYVSLTYVFGLSGLLMLTALLLLKRSYRDLLNM